MERTRSGEHKPPKCPSCGARLRVKPQRRTVSQQMWQCVACLKSRPSTECEWTNTGLSLAQFDDAEATS